MSKNSIIDHQVENPYDGMVFLYSDSNGSSYHLNKDLYAKEQIESAYVAAKKELYGQ